METITRPQVLPDVSSENLKVDLALPLSWVGMSEMELPLKVQIKDQDFTVAAKAQAGVSLDQAQAKGIHMSRLFSATHEKLALQPLTVASLKSLLKTFLQSHEGLSSRASFDVRFEAPVERTALKSGQKSFRTYPFKVSVRQAGLDSPPRIFIETVVTYSSTCPMSAALSRQLIQEKFAASFADELVAREQVIAHLGSTQGVVATPHAQRSFATVVVEVGGEHLFLAELVDLIEEALQTPVQTLVKRVDEQEFALRNGQNLMFCEDAARRIAAALRAARFADYSLEVRHAESLHPHDAVARVTAGKNLQVLGV
jgi:GTP cyclohydrolase I